MGSDGEPDRELAGPQPAPTVEEALGEGAGSVGRHRPALRFSIAAVLAVIAFWAVYAMFVLTTSGQHVENESLIGAALRSLSDRQASLESLSLVSLLSFAFAIVFIFLIAAGRRRLGLALAIAIAMGSSVVAAEILKAGLPRPALSEGPAWILRNSFPSGSATIGAAVGLALLLVSPDRLRWAALVVGAAIAAVVGQATQVSGWHRMSDVLGGILLAVIAACVALVALSRANLVRPSSQAGVSSRITTLLVVAGAGAVLLGCVILGISYAFPVLKAPAGAEAAFAHTTLDLVGSGVTVLVFVAFGRVIEPYALGAGEEVVPAAPAPTVLENI